MKKIYLLFLLISKLSFCQEWQEINLVNLVSIEFPNVPEKTESEKEAYYSTSYLNDIFLVSIRPMKKIRLNDHDLSQFYQGVSDGMIKSVGGKLINQKGIEIDGYKGREIIYKVDTDGQLPDLRIKRLMLIDDNLLSFEFWTHGNQQPNGNNTQNRFFNSLKILKEINQKDNIGESNDLGKTGFAFGKLSFLIITIFFLVGLIFLIGFLRSKKKGI